VTANGGVNNCLIQRCHERFKNLSRGWRLIKRKMDPAKSGNGKAELENIKT